MKAMPLIARAPEAVDDPAEGRGAGFGDGGH